MSYTKKYNQHKAWETHCSKNIALIESLSMPEWVFQNEQNFREFATEGIIHPTSTERVDFLAIAPSSFWDLFSFIQAYFDMDSALFDKFEQARIKRNPSSPNKS